MGYNTKATSTADNSVGIGSLGYFAGQRSVGIGELDSITANEAIAIGYDSSVSSDSSIAIGYRSSVVAAKSIAMGYQTVVSGKNSIAIGNNSQVIADNEVYIGNPSTASIGGVVNWTAASDGRFKTGITENVPGLNFIDILRPVTYNFDAKKMQAFQGVQPNKSMQSGLSEKEKQVYSGFVAQEVYEAAKSLGYDFSGVKVPLNPDKEMYGLRYAEFVVPLVKATQELHQKITEQEQIIASQQEEMKNYQEALLKLSHRLEVLETNVLMEKVTAGIDVEK